MNEGLLQRFYEARQYAQALSQAMGWLPEGFQVEVQGRVWGDVDQDAACPYDQGTCRWGALESHISAGQLQAISELLVTRLSNIWDDIGPFPDPEEALAPPRSRGKSRAGHSKKSAPARRPAKPNATRRRTR